MYCYNNIYKSLRDRADWTYCDPFEYKEVPKPMPYRTIKKNIYLTRVRTYNNKVTICWFSDGTFTKCVCSNNDAFDIDIGITICLMKKMLKDQAGCTYASFLNRVHKMMENEEKERKKALHEKNERRKIQEAREAKNKAKVEEALKQYGDIVRQSVVDAIKQVDKEVAEEMIGESEVE